MWRDTEIQEDGKNSAISGRQQNFHIKINTTDEIQT